MTVSPRVVVLIAVLALPLGAAVASYALADESRPSVPAEVRIGGQTTPSPAAVAESITQAPTTTPTTFTSPPAPPAAAPRQPAPRVVVPPPPPVTGGDDDGSDDDGDDDDGPGDDGDD
ncbi:hypothetical protein [Actinokineospora sp.]|uniref:hypothetical protein n=1 Tax=Actinokineospora sp. TaxID=1872133 RepID=UPI00403832BA